MTITPEFHDDHILTAWLDQYGIEWDVEHPPGCSRTGGWEPGCPLGLMIGDMGVFEAMSGMTSEAAAHDIPIDQLGPVIAAAAGDLLTTDGLVRVQFGYEYSGGYDYWGEFDYELTMVVRGREKPGPSED